MKTAILFVLAYLLGSIPSGIWIGKLFSRKTFENLVAAIQEPPIPFVYWENRWICCFCYGFIKRLFSHLSADPFSFGY